MTLTPLSANYIQLAAEMLGCTLLKYATIATFSALSSSYTILYYLISTATLS
jgi:hypothetical protein